MKTVHFIIERQDSPTSTPYTEEFLLPYHPAMNVVSSLMEIQKNPVTKDGKKTTAVVWECNCLEKVCGACTMVINGKVQQAVSYTHLRAHETDSYLVCRLLLEKK